MRTRTGRAVTRSRLRRDGAAVDLDRLGGDPRGLLGRKPDARGADVLGGAGATDGDRPGEVAGHLRVLHLHEAEGDGVARDPGASDLERERAGERQPPALA